MSTSPAADGAHAQRTDAVDPRTDPWRTAEPRPFGRYRLRHLLADGGMGSVYLAELVLAPGVRKWVALKLIHPHFARDGRFVEMFLNEARLAARLDHPNVCH